MRRVRGGPFRGETDLFFGSGARLEGDRVVFVGSCATVDKLLSSRAPGFAMISNSLPCLLSCVADDSIWDAWATSRSSRAFGKAFETASDRFLTVGDLQLSYFEDLRWDGCALSPSDKEHVSARLRLLRQLPCIPG